MQDRTYHTPFVARYRAGPWCEELEAWPAKDGAGVCFRLAEENGEEAGQLAALTILNPRDAARLMAFLSGWFAALPLRQRAELADGLDPERVPQGHFLARVRSAERTVHDDPFTGRPVAVDLGELLVAAE